MLYTLQTSLPLPSGPGGPHHVKALDQHKFSVWSALEEETQCHIPALEQLCSCWIVFGLPWILQSFSSFSTVMATMWLFSNCDIAASCTAVISSTCSNNSKHRHGHMVRQAVAHWQATAGELQWAGNSKGIYWMWHFQHLSQFCHVDALSGSV